MQFHRPLAIIYCPLRQHGLADDVDYANIYIYLHHTFIHLHLEPSKNINRIKINSKFVLTIYFSNCEKVTRINEKEKVQPELDSESATLTLNIVKTKTQNSKGGMDSNSVWPS